MKKYIKPQIEVSNIEVGSLLSGSQYGVETGLNKKEEDKINTSSAILSKEYSFEDDWGYEE